jgi:flagellar biosynthesis protein FlhG
MDAYAMMKTVWSLRADAVIRLVLNNVRSPREAEEAGGKLAIAVRHFLHRELQVLGSIPSDPAVPKAVVRQQPLVRAFPRSPAALSLQALAFQLLSGSLQDIERRAVSA